MKSPLQRIIEGKPVLPGVPETLFTVRFQLRNPFKSKKNYVIYKTIGITKYYYGRNSHKLRHKADKLPGNWISDINFAFRYTKREAKEMCKLWDWCKSFKIS